MTKAVARDPIYRRRRFQSETIELCVRWYLTYRLSYRDLVEMIERSNYSLEFFVTNAFNRLALATRYTECLIEVCAFPGVRPGVGGLIYVTPIQPRVIGIQFGQKF